MIVCVQMHSLTRGRFCRGCRYATGGAGVLYNARAVCVMAQTLAAGLCKTRACASSGMHQGEDIFMGHCLQQALQPINVLHSQLMFHFPPHVRAATAGETAQGGGAAAELHHTAVLGSRRVRNASDYAAHGHRRTPNQLLTSDGAGVRMPVWLRAGSKKAEGVDVVDNITMPMRYVVSMHRTGVRHGRFFRKPKNGCRASLCFASDACLAAWGTKVRGGATCGQRIEEQLDAAASDESLQAAARNVAVVQFPGECGACAPGPAKAANATAE